jgi:hypothetical protein
MLTMLRAGIAGVLTAGLAVMACGEQRSAQTSAEAESAAAMAEAVEVVEIAEIEETATEIEEAATEIDPMVAGCLALIGQGEFAQAVPACQQALEVDPGNADVQAALAKAQAEIVPTPPVAAGAEEASAAIEGATQGIPGR